MKKRIGLMFLAITLSTTLSFAGEKEELTLQRMLLMERIARLQAEFEVARRDLSEIEKKVKALEEKEKVPSNVPTPQTK